MSQITVCTSTVPVQTANFRAGNLHRDLEIINTGASFTFEVYDSGRINVQYQWYKNGNSLPGEKMKTLGIQNADSLDDAYYYCQVTDFCEIINTDSTDLDVVSGPFGFYQSLVGDTSILKVSGARGSIQWQQSYDNKNWINIAGATDSINTIINDTSYLGKRYYRAKIFDSLCLSQTPIYSSQIIHQIYDSLEQVKIGDKFQGGIVFYTYGSGHGLIAPTTDQSSSCQWGCYGTAIGSSAQSYTNGKTNTTAIVNYHDSKGYYSNPTQCNLYNNGTVAAKLCDTVSINGYDDWYLPAKNELNYLYQKKEIVGGFSDHYYWSSSEDNASYAWLYYFFNGYQANDQKYTVHRVRCIRSY